MKKLFGGTAVFITAITLWYFNPIGTGAGGALPRNVGGDATAKVKRGDMKILIAEQGRISALKSENIFHSVDGTLTIAKIVPEGSIVEKGQELVSFDNAKEKQELETAGAECKSSETELEIAKQAVEITNKENADSLSQAEFKLNAANLELEKCEKGELPQNERKMRLEIEKAESEVKQAKESYEAITDKEVLSQGFVTASEIEKERIHLRAAQIQLELAQSELEVFNRYTRPVTINTKKSERETAASNMATIKSVNANKLRQKTAELEARQEKLRQAQAKHDLAKKMLEGTVLTAPAAGLVLYGQQSDERIYYGGQEMQLRVGGQIYMNQTIITLPKLDELIVKASVSEADITSVKTGTKVNVTFDAYPGKHETGTVEKIGNVAIRNWGDATNRYDITVLLRKGDLGIKPGIGARIEIEVADLKNVLKAPISAVFNYEGRHIVYVKNGTITAREVQVGHINDTYAEIAGGLNEGDTILLYEPPNIPLPPKNDSDCKVAKE